MENQLTTQLREKLRHASDHVYLGSEKVGSGRPTYVIAEIGNNHNGDFYIAKRTIEAAAKAGAHAVKFQKRSIPDVFAKELRDKPQTKEEIKGKTYGEYREGLELSLNDFVQLKEIAEFNKVAFFATPFDLKSVDFLEHVNIPFYKVASFDVTNLPLLDYVAQTGKPIILSTGMSTLEEVDAAVSVVLNHHTKLVLLHCVSVYPSPDEHINLQAMDVLRERYAPLPVGYSGHEPDTLATIVAIARGASVIERHFTLSHSLPGPDHASVSVEPSECAHIVQSSQRIQSLLGKHEKGLLDIEKTFRDKHSKSVVATVHIPRGTIITPQMLACKSPGYGMKPKELLNIIGKRAAVDIDADTVLARDSILWEETASVVSPLQLLRGNQ